MTIKKSKSKDVGKPRALEQAQLINSASVMSAVTSEAFSKSMFPEMGLPDLIDELKGKIEKVQSGEMAAMEAMLVGQAHALQTIFVSLARRAANQEYLKNYGMFMNLALKAQSQSRATIQALTELKYPKQVAFVKQANIAHGHQQINNGDKSQASPEHAPTHAEENQNQPNKLLVGEHHGSPQMDKRATSNATRKNKAMATLEK